ncbi:hypothetical protein UA08_06701 [Talaromyces atroroseus]|uniref:Uncharacterized protein n=1 Tax=Talaromyces atroroseus TaxID=1441469 RepID=A0A225AT39_TALAT|nr:hypothetical protein UA08_06701 [Talaromyces atroroseus]OKL58116.1 hypothetical protein UA08_06701 [Talaromyces atroroseus]
MRLSDSPTGGSRLKNRSAKDIKDGVKEFLENVAPWTELRKDRVGNYALKKFLGGLLKSWDSLGPSRHTTGDERRFQTRLVTAYQHELGNALSGNYSPAFEPDSPLKLRMRIRNLNDEFVLAMTRTGHTKVFRDVNGTPDRIFVRDKDVQEEEDIYEWIRGLYQQISQILDDERGGILQTVNHYFADNLTAIRQQRVSTRLDFPGFVNGANFDLDVVSKEVYLGNEDLAYYKVALGRFNDNIVIQVTERIILGPAGAVKLFSPDYVGDLEDNELIGIAGESYAIFLLRGELMAKCEKFRVTLEVAKREAI